MKRFAAIFGSLVLLSMGGCNDSNDNTTAQPAPPLLPTIPPLAQPRAQTT